MTWNSNVQQLKMQLCQNFELVRELVFVGALFSEFVQPA